jgi:uroporphyrinogen III methyltransferase / synthase
VGSGTAAALAACGLRADLLPQRATTEGLAEALLGAGDESPRALLPRADIATPVLTAALRDAGWVAEEVEAYRTVRVGSIDPRVRERLVTGDIDIVALASSSTVRNLLELLGGDWPAGVRIASIGPVTSATCRELGLSVDAEADPHDIGGLVEAVRSLA